MKDEIPKSESPTFNKKKMFENDHQNSQKADLIKNIFLILSKLNADDTSTLLQQCSEIL